MKVTWGYDENSSDLNPMDPQNDGAWTLYSFNTRHMSFKHPSELGLGCKNGEPTVKNPGLRRKLEVGLAFFLDYFEHGNCKWSLHGSGPQCPWDTSRYGGLLVWEHPPSEMGPKSYEARAKDAASCLDEYTAWCNGEAYWYKVEDENGEEVDGCGGILSWGYLQRIIAEYKGAEVVGPE